MNQGGNQTKYGWINVVNFRSMKPWLQDYDIEMYSIQNEENFIFGERFIRTLNDNKYMTSVTKNVYIDKLDDIVNKYNNTYHSTIKIKPVDVKSSTYIDFNKENNREGLRFKVNDHVRISKIIYICKRLHSKLV